jgi:hypothetical protein
LASQSYIEIEDKNGLFNNLNQLTVSARVRKNAVDAYGTVIEKPGQFQLRISGRSVIGSVTTTEGTKILKNFLAYDADHMLWNHDKAFYEWLGDEK